MRKLAFVVLLLAACGRREPAAVPAAGITIVITADGYVNVDGKAVTLDEMGLLVAAAKAGVGERTDDPRVSSLRAALDLDEGTLWRHVLMVLDVLAEQKVRRVTFPGERDWLMPADSWHEPSPDGKALLVRVLVLENGTYAVGDRVPGDVKEVGRWIYSEPTPEDIVCLVGVIQAAPRVPWRLVHPVFDLLRSCDPERIDFYGVFPDAGHRRVSPLPVPPSGTPRLEWSGLFVVNHYRPGTYEEPDPRVPLTPQAGPDDDLFALLDSHRADLGLQGFAPKEVLRWAASAHAQEMARMGYYGHFSPVPGNRSPSDRLAKVGWPEERRHAELLAKAATAEEALKAILEKPENAKVLADPAFRYAGVAQSGDCWVVLLGADE